MWRNLRSALRGPEGPDSADRGSASAETALPRIAVALLATGFDRSLDQILRQVGEVMAADRCYTAFLSSDLSRLRGTREWCSAAAEPSATSDFEVEDLPPIVKILLQGGTVQIKDLDALPPEAAAERRLLEARGVRSAVATTIETQGKALGWIGVETVAEARTWSDQQLTFLGHIADLLAEAARQQERRGELQRLALGVEQSPATVIITDPDGVIEYVNPQFTKTCGYSADEAVGKVIKIPEHPDIPGAVYEDLWATVRGGDGWRGELINRRKDGSYFWEAVSVSPIRDTDGSLTHYIGVKEDITERRLYQEQLERAQEETERASRAKNEFMANMSHEIRTPVNAIIGIAHLAMQGKLGDRHRDHLRKIRSSSQTLLGIINSILDFSNIDAGRMTIESFDFRLEDVLDNVSDLLRAKARAKGLKLEVDVPKEVPGALVGDAFRLGQVLINLGDNAVKFTEKGNVSVAVALVDADPHEATLRFSVRDTGIGLDEAQINRLFQPFTQIDGSSTRPFGGTGLGLAIANRLVEMMGGEIGVYSRPGEGSDFHFTLSLAQQGAEPSRRDQPPPDLRDMRILVADDSQTSRLVLCEALRSFSFSATAVESGEAAIAELEAADSDPEQKPFELVLMDWKMPAMDGLETSRRIKEHDGLEHIPPVILITGYGREDVILQADKAMLDGFMLKPINPSILFDAIMSALGREGGGSETEHSNDEPTDPVAIPGGRVLVVEDNLLNQEVAAELLGDMGLAVRIADNGREAIDALLEESFDLVLMDVQMPVMDGYEATAEIRKLPDLAKIPIVAMTAHAMSGDRERCLEAGMDDYISKPIDTSRLFELVSQWIESAKPVEEVDSEAPEDAAEVLPDELEGINIKAGLGRIGGNKVLFRKLLLQFLHDYKDVIDTIRTALELGHHESGERLLHTLKGVAATIGAERVHRAARELEASVNSGQSTERTRLLANLDRSLIPVIEAISTMETTPLKAAVESADQQKAQLADHQVEPVLRELAQLIEEGDPEAAELLETLAPSLVGSAAAAHINALDQHIENFDFDDALTAVRKLADSLNIRLARSIP